MERHYCRLLQNIRVTGVWVFLIYGDAGVALLLSMAVCVVACVVMYETGRVMRWLICAAYRHPTIQWGVKREAVHYA